MSSIPSQCWRPPRPLTPPPVSVKAGDIFEVESNTTLARTLHTMSDVCHSVEALCELVEMAFLGLWFCLCAALFFCCCANLGGRKRRRRAAGGFDDDDMSTVYSSDGRGEEVYTSAFSLSPLKAKKGRRDDPDSQGSSGDGDTTSSSEFEDDKPWTVIYHDGYRKPRPDHPTFVEDTNGGGG